MRPSVLWQRLVRQACTAMLCTALGLLCWLSPGVPAAQADALNTVDTPEYQQLTSELSGLQAKGTSLTAAQSQRLADLQQLEAAIAGANDRATISNASTHNLGIFARYKKEPAEQPASFYVLGPGHQSDDDYEVLALYVPPQIDLSWGEQAGQSGVSSPRVVRVLPGEELEVAEGTEAPEAQFTTYELSLPAFALETQDAQLASIPRLSQDDLDAQAETAPVD